jgi:dihydrodipicolinate synthase/N-acetylneuraminate lyase
VITDALPRGIVPVLQTPFDQDGNIDVESLDRLIEDAVRARASGILAPAVASEVDYLTRPERQGLIRTIAGTLAGRLPFIVGASSDHTDECVEFARLAGQVDAAAYLVAVPEALYHCPEEIPGFFETVASASGLPLIVQDLQWNGPGLTLDTLRRLKETIPTLAGIKIETVPVGPKYTDVREEFGEAFFICGGWAVPQMIEAMDRGVDAMIPEASMVRVYAAIHHLHAAGDRRKAAGVFRDLLPVLAFANQEIRVSIAFFKALLVRKRIFRFETMRWPGFRWDAYNRRTAEELIDLYLDLEERVRRLPLASEVWQEHHDLRHQGEEQ